MNPSVNHNNIFLICLGTKIKIKNKENEKEKGKCEVVTYRRDISGPHWK